MKAQNAHASLVTRKLPYSERRREPVHLTKMQQQKILHLDQVDTTPKLRLTDLGRHLLCSIRLSPEWKIKSIKHLVQAATTMKTKIKVEKVFLKQLL